MQHGTLGGSKTGHTLLGSFQQGKPIAWPGSQKPGYLRFWKALPSIKPLASAISVEAPPCKATRVKSTDPTGRAVAGAYGTPERGNPEPLGATINPDSGATNFALFSANATGVILCLFTEQDLVNGKVTHQLRLDRSSNRTGDIWHVALPKLDSKLLYGYVVEGPNQKNDPPASAGQAFDISNVVLDPHARAIVNGRRIFGQMGPDLDYKSKGILGYAATWPQAAAALPGAVPDFDWEGDRQLGRPMEDLVIYEAHVRGFTADPASGVNNPGTYQGLIDRLDYLQTLGITALELMPIQEFNELEYFQVAAAGGSPGRYNFWGYSTVGFFAPMSRFSAAVADPKLGAGAAAGAAINEFKTLVKECHRRGIEVILDVVFNHTAEGNENGLTLSFRGIDNRVYYMLAPGGECYNYSGCGNTFNCNHPVARQFIIDCLRYWVEECHVDGFRFDLGSIMTRAHSQWYRPDPTALYGTGDEQGDFDGAEVEGNGSGFQSSGEISSGEGGGGIDTSTTYGGNITAPFSGGAVINEDGIMTNGAGVPTGTPLTDPPLIAAISADPILAKTKLIAEAWDCDGLNQVGAFPHYGGRWSEWNGYFRDATRQFIKGTDGGWAGAFASALCGSPNIYVNEPGEQDWWGNNGGRKWKSGRGPTASINFVTAHDGFTLADLVAYNEKHNEANGEDNRDGESHNLSWNCGEEGPTNDAAVLALRRRQTRNFVAALLLSHGVPMIVMGDEYGHTKGGNNNTYCHDNSLNYFNWEQAKKDADGLLRFTRHMIGFRKAHKELRRSSYVSDNDVEWHGIVPEEPDWTETSRFLALTLRKPGANAGGVYIAFNTSHQPLMVELPRWEGRVWQPVVDTGKSAPYDILVADERLPATEVEAARAAAAMWTNEHAYPILPWSSIVLESIPAGAVAEMPDERRAELNLGGSSSSSGSSTSGKKKAGTARKLKAAKTGSGSESD